MTTEKHDPWALLREARDFMHRAAISRGPCPDCTECDYRDAIIAKTDAALAAHATDKFSPPDIKWEEKDANRFGIYPHEADYSDDVFLTVEQHLLKDEWIWRVERAGCAKDEADAKTKAVEYAGRLT